MENKTGDSAYLQCIRVCNNAKLTDYVPWSLDGQVYGWIEAGFAAQLQRFPHVFVPEHGSLGLHPDWQGQRGRSLAVGQVMQQLHHEGVIDTWVGETYPVVQTFGDEPVLVVERATASFLGIRSFGIHVNGLVQKAEGVHVWVGTRTQRKPFWPGKLDQMVAGGMPTGISILDNLCKEAQEEANIPEGLARQAQPVATLRYRQASWRGLENSTLFVYDLWLPESFIPENTDGEVEAFQLLPVADIACLTAQVDAFKDNCNLVNIDLLLRLGLLPATDILRQGLYEQAG